jgi:dihydroorotase
MITFKNVTTLSGKTLDVEIESDVSCTLDATGLLLMPGLIDPHVHFRTPGYEYKENWESAAQACLRGGITTVFDMPNTHPSTITEERLKQKKQLIDTQLKQCGIPLHYHLYFGMDKHHFEEIEKVKDQIIALKVFMGSSTGDLLMDDDSSLHAAFALAKAHDLLLCVHSEDEEIISKNAALYKQDASYAAHSRIRSKEAAVASTKKALQLARIYKTRLHILHVSTAEELPYIEAAKKEGLSVTCETTPHHLFLNEEAYTSLQGRAQVNPPLRTQSDNIALLQALHQGVIDIIGSDHAPHTLEEKKLPYGKAPSGMPGVETTLPLLLTAYHEKKLSLDQIVKLTCSNIQKIYRLPPNEDVILVDLYQEKTITDDSLATRCGWSPFSGKTLKGFPVYAVLKGNLYHLQQTVGIL